MASLPSLIWISSFFWWASLADVLPRGLVAIVVVHSLMNVGLIAIGLELILRARLSRFNEVAQVMGLPSWKFWAKVALPLLWKDMVLLGLVVFGFCFTSLSVPLIFSTAKASTLEVLIFQLGVREGAWGQALVLSLFQWALIAAMALSLGWFQIPQVFPRSSWRWVAPPIFQWVFAIPVLFLILSHLSLVAQFTKLSFWHEVGQVFHWSSLIGSLFTLVSVALIFLLLILGVGLIGPQGLFKNFMRSYASPSMAIMGVFLFLIPGESIGSDLLKLSFGLSFLFFPGLYRWLGEPHFEALRNQWDQARILGARPSLIARRIWWPQSFEVLSLMIGLACLWAVSDFALSGMLLQRPYSIALTAQSAFNSYRVDIGMTYTLICLSLGIGVFVLVRKLLNVRS